MLSRSQFRLRVGIIGSVVLFLGAALLVRLYFVQIVHGAWYRQEAEKQYIQPTQNLYDRGSIFFTTRDGQLVSGATLKVGVMVVLDPREIEDPEAAYEALSRYIPLEKESFMRRASKRDDPYEEIAHRLPEEIGRTIDRADIPGVMVRPERWRYYPGGPLASHVLGFIAYKGDELSGRYGLERTYERVLARFDSGMYVNFFAEIFSDIRTSLFSGSEQMEGDVVTSIEPSVQLVLEEKLEEVAERWRSKLTGGIVMDPKTGAVYALAVRPSFDLNRFFEAEDVSIFNNPLVESVYEMGSIVKPIVMASGIDAGAVSPESEYTDTGRVTVGAETISNWDGVGRGTVSIQEVLNQSLNTGMAYVARQMGNEAVRTYLRDRFKLGEPTGIDLPNEARGIIGNLESPRAVEYATAAFGQGIAMTPINTVRALSALANGGVLVTPHIAERISYEEGGGIEDIPHETAGQAIRADTSETITRMLVGVVDDALLGGTVALPNYSIAAKTGTAQIAKEGERGYYDDRYLHSFFGYFPAYNPRFIVFLYTLEPEGATFASHTLTRPFMDIAQFLINYYEIPPDR